ncbi:MAG: DUF1499 domain-containing protein [Promethearchaeota archaeon]
MKKSKKPIGIVNGQFQPCPKSPNCVSTQSSDKMHKMIPLIYSSTVAEAIEKIKNIIKTFKRTKLITETENYLHFEFRSATFKFVDDVEFYFDEKEKLIHFRSASRLGWSDMGVNKKRMKSISKLYSE